MMKCSSSYSVAFIVLAMICSLFACSDNEKIKLSRSSAATNALKIIRNDLDIPVEEHNTNLIIEEKFNEFEELSKQYELKFRKDPLYESPFIKLFMVLNITDARVLPMLDKWIKERPSYISYGVRGVYKTCLGFHIRGEKYIRDTPRVNIDKMIALHNEAKSDLVKAVGMNKRFVAGYYNLIRIEMASGNRAEIDRIIEIGTAAIPETYYIRYAYLKALRPRWGGSYARMKKYISKIDDYVDLNPRIWSLKGELSAEIAYSAKLNGVYEKSIEYYTDALSYGDRLSFLYDRADAYLKTGKYNLALKDYIQYKKYDANDNIVNNNIEAILYKVSKKGKS